MTKQKEQDRFKAPWWAKNRHIQTIWPRYFVAKPSVKVTEERLELPDGDFVDLAWSQPNQKPKGLVVIFHGLEGSLASHYIKHMKGALLSKGWATVLMHFRGCSGVPNRLSRYYHSGETTDARFCLEFVAKRCPNLPLMSLGYSLGANVLLKLLGEDGPIPALRAAVAISAPLKLADCAKSINQGFSKVYQRYLIRRMQNSVQRKVNAGTFNKDFLFSLGDFWQLKTFSQFDDKFTAPLHGFKDADDYYAKSSAFGFLKKITTPTLLIHAKDDPFMTHDVVPTRTDVSDAVTLEVSERGGHVGFLAGQPWKPKLWLNDRVPSYFDFILSQSVHMPSKS